VALNHRTWVRVQLRIIPSFSVTCQLEVDFALLPLVSITPTNTRTNIELTYIQTDTWTIRRPGYLCNHNIIHINKNGFLQVYCFSTIFHTIMLLQPIHITSQIILSSLPLNFIFHDLLFIHICSRSRIKFINSVADLNKSTTHLVERIYLKIKKAVETLINWKIFHPQLFSFPFLQQDKVFLLVTLKKLFSCKKNKNHQLGIINSI